MLFDAAREIKSLWGAVMRLERRAKRNQRFPFRLSDSHQRTNGKITDKRAFHL